MFLPSCARLAAKEPTLASVIGRLDDALAIMGPAGELVPSDLAYLLEEEPARIEDLLAALVELGGLDRQERIFCENGCFSVTPSEYEDSLAEGEVVRCPECDTRVKKSKDSTRSVYVIREVTSESSSAPSNVAEGHALAAGQTYKMLFAAANPDVQQTLAVDQEWRRIEQRFLQKQCRVEIQRIDLWATTTNDLRQAILDHRPSIVHFSGHGTTQRGLNFMNDAGQVRRVSGRALAGLFRLFGFIECVLLNACHSADQADSISKHVHCVIAMKGEIGDESAIEFSAGFYDALTAGEPFGRCFQVGLNALDLANLTDVDCPTVWIDGINHPIDLPSGD